MTFLLTSLLNFYFFLPSNAADIKKIMDDFKDNQERRWQFYRDQVMGGISEGRASFLSGSEGSYVRLQGLVSTANNGGLIHIGTKITAGVKDSEGILLEVRGNGENYYIHLNTNETIFLPQQYRYYYQTIFPTSKDWTKVKLPFSIEFKRSNAEISKYFNGEQVRAIGILGYGKEHKAFLEANYLSFY